MKREITYDDYEKLREYVKVRNSENWGVWPAVETWPVPENLGAWTATQYEVRRQNVTVIKFDHPITLPDGDVVKRIGMGRFLPFEMADFKELDKSECDARSRQIELLPKLQAVGFENRIESALLAHKNRTIDEISAACLTVCAEIGREVNASPEDVKSAYYL